MKAKHEIEDLWLQNGIAFEIYVTKNHADIAVAVQRYIKSDANELIVVGGDGTLLAAVNALEDLSMPIGIVPCGTGNDFARTHGISLQADHALKNLLHWEATKDIDVGNSNGSHFLNVASIGIDAEIVKRTHQVRKWIRGPMVYLVSSIIEILFYKPLNISLSVDGHEFDRTIELVAVANGCCYGGGMKIAPMADPADGVYNVILAKKMNRLRLICLLPKLYAGSHVGEPEVEIYSGKDILIKLESDVTINMDGELTQGSILSINESKRKVRIITSK